MNRIFGSSRVFLGCTVRDFCGRPWCLPLSSFMGCDVWTVSGLDRGAAKAGRSASPADPSGSCTVKRCVGRSRRCARSRCSGGAVPPVAEPAHRRLHRRRRLLRHLRLPDHRPAAARGRPRPASSWPVLGAAERRLLPAAYVVLVASAVGVLSSCRSAVAAVLQEIAASTLYVQNWVLGARLGRLPRRREPPSPVQHFWTLRSRSSSTWSCRCSCCSALAGARRSPGVDGVSRCSGAATVARLGYSLSITAANPASPTSSPYPRLGVRRRRAARLRARRAGEAPPVRERARRGSALAMLLQAPLSSPRRPRCPGTAALCVLGALRVIWVRPPDPSWSHVALLRCAPCMLGDISYSLYLWHWPLIILVPFATGRRSPRSTGS